MALVPRAVAAALAALTAIAAPAYGNGDEFYRFNALDPKNLATQVIFAGVVKDVDGRHLSDVKITVATKVETYYGEKTVSFNAYTNIAGRYRALDVASVVLTLEEIEVEVDPAEVDVTAQKSGYVVTRKLNRSRTGQKTGLFEIDFTMRKVE